MKVITKSFVFLLLFGVVLAPCCGPTKRLEAWNIYKGEVAAYRVEIDESMRGGVWTRLIHLEPVKGYEEPTPNPFAITGHDYDDDGLFDRVFIRELSVNGYNSVAFTGKGERVWEPCPADKYKVRPFTDTQVEAAQAELYLAMGAVYNRDHIVSTLESFRAKQE